MIMRVLSPWIASEIIRERRRLGIDGHDEVWDGVYVVSPFANNPHQTLVNRLAHVLTIVIEDAGRGVVHPGANVSDRPDARWEKNHRVPDVVVVLPGSRAVDRGTHWYGGPDFVVEVQSPGDDTEAKIPFYTSIGVRELLIIHRDSRRVRLFRHDGAELAPVAAEESRGKSWLVSDVVPLAFCRVIDKGRKPRTVVRRTDGKRGRWEF
jgi:Uma2 family endonuclease